MSQECVPGVACKPPTLNEKSVVIDICMYVCIILPWVQSFIHDSSELVSVSQTVHICLSLYIFAFPCPRAATAFEILVTNDQK
ncbi:hypothetical protein BDV24DRAFT_134260 [Aspergillus arachidicola]|uniref:Uncharacterized protein n=1 Tax=Aspergillus arachidicola TaxID=656916 RepID=A0A5N6Y3T8_9EURO|nr:hypothetical protein BDV24DRAFT_134260 [Aspergillus arachidicola]